MYIYIYICIRYIYMRVIYIYEELGARVFSKGEKSTDIHVPQKATNFNKYTT